MFELRTLCAGYAGTAVLRGVDLIVPPRSVVALLRPNGAGKTTLLRTMSGLLAPTTGEIRLNGADVGGHGPEALARLGVCHIPEGRGVFGNLTVRENLLMFSPVGRERASLDRAVEAFPRLGERMDQLAGTMSGGEQQQLALARAYLQHPRFVLLDEVSMGLAPRVVDEVFAFLRRLADAGAALLIVEQYVSRAVAAADYVYLMSRGEIAFAGEPDELDADALADQYVGAPAA